MTIPSNLNVRESKVFWLIRYWSCSVLVVKESYDISKGGTFPGRLLH